METIQYPLLCNQLQDGAVLGMLIGTPHRMVAPDVQTLKSQFQDFLRKDYKKTSAYPEVFLSNAQLKVLDVRFRPAFREPWGNFPLPYAVNIPVPVIYGWNPQGYYECFIPFFKERFPFYELDHLEPLAMHIANYYFHDAQPEEILSYLRYSPPVMEFVSLKVKPWMIKSGNRHFPEQEPETLSRLADAYPYARSRHKPLSPFPEAAWERESEVEAVVENILSARTNVLVIGQAGSGKSAVLQQAIRQVASRARTAKVETRCWRIQPQRITASARYLGEWEATCEEIINELAATNGILWVESIIQLLMAGGGGPENSVAAFFRPALQNGKIQMIGEATPQELESMRRLLPGFVESFQIVHLDPLPEDKIQSVQQKYAHYAKTALRINIQANALELSYRLLNRFFPYESFPGKAIRFLGKCLASAQLQQQAQISQEDVIRQFIQDTGLPELLLRDDMPLDPEELSDFFNRRIIGQPGAIRQLCNVVKIFKAGLNNPNRPIATMIFAGPTGVGKTASAKALADYFFGKGQRRSPLIRIDMSEFQHPSQIFRLIGGGEDPGKLIKEVRERPFSVVLLDEIEKAHPATFDALMTMLDEGLLADAFGRQTHFKNSIIIMTTNLGADRGRDISFYDSNRPDNRYQSAIFSHFRPEFVNRIDSTIIFSALNQDQIREIAQKELEELNHREGFIRKQIKLAFTQRLINQIASVGFDERYGARPLQRAVEQTVVNPIANWLLDHPSVRNQVLEIDWDNALIIQLKKTGKR